MRAIICERYGSPDVLELRDVDVPAIGDDGVLVRVRAASVNAYDWHHLRGEPLVMRLSEGRRRPTSDRLGIDVAGVVEAVGEGVTEFKPGDEVFGFRFGAFADYVAGKERNFLAKPPRLTFEEAAAVPVAGFTALQGLRDKARLRAGQKVLINGASGGVGTFAVQIAKALGAEVTAVCGARNAEQARALGADRVIDYTKQDFTRRGERYDVVFDIAGSRSIAACRRALVPEGLLVLVGGPAGRWLGPMRRVLLAKVTARFASQRSIAFFAQNSKDDLRVLRGLIDDGKVTPVIDRRYALRDVPEAIRYVEAGHARGKVVITV